jgi:hypothetical protein
MRVREEAGIGRLQWQVERIVAIALVVLSIAGLTHRQAATRSSCACRVQQPSQRQPGNNDRRALMT